MVDIVLTQYMDYLAFTEVHYLEVSLNRLEARYYNPAKIIAQTCGKLQLQVLYPQRQIIVAGDRAGRASHSELFFSLAVPQNCLPRGAS